MKAFISIKNLFILCLTTVAFLFSTASFAVTASGWGVVYMVVNSTGKDIVASDIIVPSNASKDAKDAYKVKTKGYKIKVKVTELGGNREHHETSMNIKDTNGKKICKVTIDTTGKLDANDKRADITKKSVSVEQASDNYKCLIVDKREDLVKNPEDSGPDKIQAYIVTTAVVPTQVIQNQMMQREQERRAAKTQ